MNGQRPALLINNSHPPAPLLATLPLLLLLSSCANTGGPNARHATVLLRDGGTYSGSVVKTTATEITLAGDDKSVWTLDMRDVKSVDYADAPGGTAPERTPQRASIPVQARPESTHAQEPTAPVSSSVLPAGTRVSVRSQESIDSATAAEGQAFAADVTRDVADADGVIVIPRGSNARIVIRSASTGGRLSGASDLVLDLSSVSIDGQQYPVESADLIERGKDSIGANKRTAEYTGGGAAIGAVIGAIAGHGKGAAIGAASGAAAGAAGEMLTKGGAIRLPAESVLTFELNRPLRVFSSRTIRARNDRLETGLKTRP